MKSERGRIQKSLLTKWVVSSTVGWILGLLGSIIVAHLVNLIYPKETDLVYVFRPFWTTRGRS